MDGFGRRNRLTVGMLAAAAAILAAGIAGLGTLASYRSQASGSTSVTGGFVTIALGATGAKTNRLTTAVTDLEPGDTLFRSFDLISSTTLLSSLTVAVTDTASAPKLSTATTGLQLKLERCSVAWTESGSSPAFTYSCSGTRTTLLSSGDVLRSATSLSGLDATNSSATLPTTDHLLATLSLPTTSPSTDQSATSTITYTFTGTQLTSPAKSR